MFNHTIKGLFVVGLLIFGGLTAANAQIGYGSAIKFDVDHSFVVQDKTFPAGKYTISRLAASDGSTSTLELRSINGKEFAVFDTMENLLHERAKNTELMFDHAGDTYVLSEIRIEGDEQASQILETKAEKQTLAAAATNE